MRMGFAKYDGQCTPAIGGISYAFPAASRTIGELASDNQLASSVETLESFGFGRVHVAVEETPYELALTAGKRLLEENSVDPQSVGLLIYGGTPGSMAFADPARSEAAA